MQSIIQERGPVVFPTFTTERIYMQRFLHTSVPHDSAYERTLVRLNVPGWTP
jgi:hypothetical protein